MTDKPTVACCRRIERPEWNLWEEGGGMSDPEICVWKKDEWHDCYEALCGVSWWFENTEGVNFCPNCGKPVRVQEEEE